MSSSEKWAVRSPGKASKKSRRNEAQDLDAFIHDVRTVSSSVRFRSLFSISLRVGAHGLHTHEPLLNVTDET